MPVHPQVAELLLRAARSALPPYHTVSAPVARRIYRDTRAVLAPQAPELPEIRLLATESFSLRVYRPVKNERLPALVYFHGGGWTIGDIDTHDVLCRSLALGARCVVVSVDYRLAPEYPFPAAVDDCFAAARYVADALLLPDDAIRAAQLALWKDFKLAVEPAAALGLAALQTGAYVPRRGETVALVLCGANLDPATLA